jgi:hypothetical protein
MTVLSGCSPALSELLDPSRDFTLSVEEIASREELAGEGRALLAGLQAANRKATGTEIMSALFPLIAIYGVSDRSESEWTSFWKVYIEDLGDYPLWAVEEAVRRYRRARDSNFFPRPGPLRSLCIEAFRTAMIAQNRLERGLAVTA